MTIKHFSVKLSAGFFTPILRETILLTFVHTHDVFVFVALYDVWGPQKCVCVWGGGGTGLPPE